MFVAWYTNYNGDIDKKITRMWVIWILFSVMFVAWYTNYDSIDKKFTRMWVIWILLLRFVHRKRSFCWIWRTICRPNRPYAMSGPSARPDFDMRPKSWGKRTTDGE